MSPHHHLAPKNQKKLSEKLKPRQGKQGFLRKKKNKKYKLGKELLGFCLRQKSKK